MDFFRVHDLPEAEMLPGVRRRAAWLEGVMLTFFEFEPNADVPVHDHPHEQITYVLEGGLVLTLGRETRHLGPGEGVCVAPGVSHSARVIDQHTVVVDAWSPPREDYKTTESV